MFFRKKKKKARSKDKGEMDSGPHRRLAVVSTKAHPKRPPRGRSTLKRHQSVSARGQPVHVPKPAVYDRSAEVRYPGYRPNSPREVAKRQDQQYDRHAVNYGRHEQPRVRRQPQPPDPPPLKPPVPGSKQAGIDNPRMMPRVSRVPARDGPERGYIQSEEQDLTRSGLRPGADIRRWLSWRVKVNDQLSSYVMRARNAEDGHRKLAVDELPDSIADRTVGLMLALGERHGSHPTTSLDQVSYMIYGVPRVHIRKPLDPAKRKKTFRNQRQFRRTLRRKPEVIRQPAVDSGRVSPATSVYNPGYAQTSCQEQTLDFEDDCIWPEETCSRSPEVNRRLKPAALGSELRERIAARARHLDHVDKVEHSRRMLAYDTRYDRPELPEEAAIASRGNMNSASPPRYLDQISYNQPIQNSPQSQQSNFKPPGGVPTILSLYNLPNQAQVPLRHVTTRQKATKQ